MPHGDAKLIQSPFSFPKPPPLCPVPPGATAAPRSCPSLRRGCAGAGEEALPCIILYGFQPSCSLVLQAAWRGACGGSAAFATCPSDLDLSLEKSERAEEELPCPFRRRAHAGAAEGGRHPPALPHDGCACPGYHSAGMAVPGTSQKNKPAGESCPLALWGPEGSRRDLGSPTPITPGGVSTWRGKSSGGGTVVPVPSPTPLSLLPVTFNFELAAAI